MSTIKITSGSVARRITVQPTAEWTDLARNLVALFNLPANAASTISLSYTDAENDTIVLDTITELQDAITQGITKFRLSEDPNGDWILEGAETPKTANDTISIHSGFEESHLADREETQEEVPAPPQYSTTVEEVEETEEPKEDQSRIEKGKQKEETPSESSKQSESKQPESSQPSQNPDEPLHFNQIAQQIENLMDQFQVVLEQNPELVATAHNLMDQIGRSITGLNCQRDTADSTSPFDIFVQLGNHPSFQRRGPWGSPAAFGGFHPGFHHRGPFHDPFRGPFIGPFGTPYSGHPSNRSGCQRRCGGETNGLTEENKKAMEERMRACKEARAKYWQRRCGDEGRELTEEEQKRQRRCGGGEEQKARTAYQQCPWRNLAVSELPAEEIKSKMNQLNAMGFYVDDAEDLLKRYNGNIERVVDLLIQRQTATPAADNEKAFPYQF